MSNINFDNPWLLLIAVPLIVLFTIPFLIAVRKDNRNGHNITSQILHIVLALIIGFAAAGTKVVTVLTQTHVYIVADVSYSANKNLDTIDNIIKNQLVLPKNSKVGIVTFGKDYELLCDLVDQNNVTSVKESKVDDSETNIAEALEYAGTLFSQDVIKRIVLITDAKQTDEEDTNAMRRAVDLLDQQDIKVDAFFLDDNLSSDTPEVQISSGEFTRSAFIKHNEFVRLTIQSNVETRGMIRLFRENGGVKEEVEVRALEVKEGQNVETFALYTDEGGTYNYEVRITDMEQDKSEYNNTYSFTQTVSADRKMLVVTNEWSNCETIISQYGDTSSIDLYENSNDGTATGTNRTRLYNQYAANPDINLFNFRGQDNSGDGDTTVPYTVERLCEYDQIVLADINFTKMPESYRTEFVSSLNTVVEKFGKSLITIGNIEGGNVATELGRMLPVRYGKSEDLPNLYTIVLDASYSMDEQGKISVAKDVAARLVNTMQDSDYVCIVYFDGDSWLLNQPIPVTNPDEIARGIMGLDIRQGTRIDAGLRRAQSEISGRATSYSDKTLMLITDGANAGNSEDLSSIAAEMLGDEIVTSVIYVEGNGNLAADQRPYEGTLRAVANAGGGNYYYINAMTGNFGDVQFGQLTDALLETDYEGAPVKVKALRDTDSVFGGIPMSVVENIPDITGYYISYAKSSATTVMEIQHVKSTTGKLSPIPLYAYWTHGKGKVASFTSKISGNWLQQWRTADITDDFFDNVSETNVPNEKSDYPYSFNVIQDGSFTYVQVVPESLRLFKASATMKLTMPDRSVSERVLVWNDNQLYYGDSFKSAEVGRYEIEVTYVYEKQEGNEVSYTSTAVINVSFSSEYDEFATFEASPLFRAINGRGQVILEGVMTLENDEHEVGTYTNDFSLPLLIIAVVVFVIDIIVRKLKWEDIKSFFGGFKKQDAKQEGKKQ